VNPSVVTTIGVSAEASPNLTPEQRALLSIQVQPGSLVGENGQPLATGQVGISTVPPELVRDMLPPGVLQHTFDITVQAPGISNFSTPAPMTFPNVFNAAPGTKLNFLSFDHTTGRLVIEGTATVSEDGLSVTTDPGMGITHPGWHGLTGPGSTLVGSIGGPLPAPKECTGKVQVFLSDAVVLEGDAGEKDAVFKVTLSNPCDEEVSALVETVIPAPGQTATEGADYHARTQQLYFAAGQTTLEFRVPVVGDRIEETTESFFAEIVAAENATIARQRGKGTIVDNDGPPNPNGPEVSVLSSQVVEGSSGTVLMAFSVVLSGPSQDFV
jgi:hypothetical protein